MNTEELLELLQRNCYTKDVSIFPRDKLKVDRLPFYAIVNNDTSSNSGSHWICLKIDQNRNAEFFCSYGSKPVLFENFLRKNCNSVCYNDCRVQLYNSETCGLHCMFVIQAWKLNYTLHYIIENMYNKNDHVYNELLVLNVLH